KRSPSSSSWIVAVEARDHRRRCCTFCIVLHRAKGEVLAAGARSTPPLLLLRQSTLSSPVVGRCCNFCIVLCLVKGEVPFTRSRRGLHWFEL
ncbi:hypothetical protein PIB30_079290, partial [Stylosanthes scabra]|nr:hypothetical protein [Stylosanthes scabra]